MVDDDVDRTGGGELGVNSGVYIGEAAESVGQKEGVGVASRCDGERREVIDADESARAVWKRQGNDRLANRLVRSLARLALDTAAEPSAGANVHADPPVEERKYAESPRNTCSRKRWWCGTCAEPTSASTQERRRGVVGSEAEEGQRRHGAVKLCVIGGRE